MHNVLACHAYGQLIIFLLPTTKTLYSSTSNGPRKSFWNVDQNLRFYFSMIRMLFTGK